MSAAKLRRRALAGSLVMAAALVAGVTRAADAQWIYINSVTPASSGASAAVSIEFYSRWAAQEVCEPDGWCYPMTTYEGYADPGTFTVTVNGANRTSAFSVSLAEASVCDYYGLNDYDCYDRYAASASAMPTTAGASNAMTASVAVSNYGTPSASSTFTAPGASRAPTISLEPHNGANRQVSACVMHCFEGVLSYTTPSYTSLDAERSVTLVYNSRRVAGQRLVQVDATHPSSAGTAPVTMSLKLQRADGSWVTWYHTGGTELFYQSGSGTTRLAGWFDDAPYDRPSATLYTAHVTSYFGDGTTATNSVAVRVLSGYSYHSGHYGHGWAIANVDALYGETDGGLVLASGDGSLAYYGPCAGTCSPHIYISPAGDPTRMVRVAITADRTYERRFPDESVAEYDNVGRLRKVRDRFGNATTYNYIGQSTALVSIVDPAGKAISLGHTYNGYLDYIQDPGGRVTDITIDETTGRLTSIRRPDGVYAVQITAYVGNHLPATWLDERGGQWDWGWGGYGRPHALYAPPTWLDHNPGQRATTNYHPYEHAVFAALDGGKGTSTAPGDRLIPGAVNLRAIVADPKGNHTYLTLDRWGAPTITEEPLGRVTRAHRDTLGRVRWTRSPSGHAIRYDYGLALQPYDLTYVFDSTQAKGQTYEYVAGTSYLARSSGDLETETVYTWSSDGLPRRVLSARSGSSANPGPTIRYGYDASGRVKWTKDDGNHVQMTVFGSGSGSLRNTQQLMMTTDTIATANPRTLETWTYDSYGRVLTSANGEGKLTRFAYDSLNRVTRTVGPANDTTQVTYGAYESTVADAKGSVYRTYVNALGWTTQTVDPYGKASDFAYDRGGHLVWARNRNGGVTTFAYDALGQLTQRAAGNDVTTYATDPSGAWTMTSNGESVDTLHFDALGRDTLAVTVRNGGTDRHTVKHTYNARDQRTAVDYRRPGVAWHFGATYAYNAKDQLQQIALHQAETFLNNYTVLTYDGDGMVTNIQLPYNPTGPGIGKKYSGLHRPSEQTFGGGVGNSYQLNRRLAYDAAGRTHRRLDYYDPRSGREFLYDDAGRLRQFGDFFNDGSECTPIYQSIEPLPGEEPVGYDCSATSYDGTPTEFLYDKVGNPAVGLNGVAVNRNRLTAYGGWTLHYDDEGNLTQRDSAGYIHQFSWTVDGKLGGFYSNELPGWTWYGYDGWGRRVRKYRAYEQSPTYERYVYDGDAVIAEYTDHDATQVYYSHYPGVDQPHAMWRNGALYYHQQDAEGNIVGLTNANGILVNQYRYDPFGTIEPTTDNVTNRYRFKGREFDPESGMYFMRARYYHPRLHRFISEDPIGLAGGINPYAFAGNDPVNYRDPSGTETEEVCELWKEFYPSTGKVVRYFWKCEERPGGGNSGNTQTAPVPPDACPAPPRAPGGVDIDANMAWARSMSNTGQPGAYIGKSVWFAGMSFRGQPWDFKASGPFDNQMGTGLYAPFGNFHYGAVGTATGYSAGLLQNMAGAVQNVDDRQLTMRDPRAWLTLGLGFTGLRTFQDSGTDSADIAAGIQYANNRCDR